MLIVSYCAQNLHVGSGENSESLVDLPVAREQGVPCIPASASKGAIKKFVFSKIDKAKSKDAIKWFGSDENHDGNDRGEIDFSDALPLLFSMPIDDYATYQWVVSVSSLNALRTMLAIKKISLPVSFSELNANSALISENSNVGKNVAGFEVRSSNKIDTLIDEFFLPLLEETGKTLPHLILKEILQNKLMLIDDASYSELINTLPNRVRIVLEPETGTSLNLFDLEYVPQHSIFLSALFNTQGNVNSEFSTEVSSEFIQFGGQATTGYGHMLVTCVDGLALENECETQ